MDKPEGDTGFIVHTVPPHDIYKIFETPTTGLTTSQADDLRVKHGRNVLVKQKKSSITIRFIRNFTHLMALLLWIGGIVAIIAQMPQLGIAIWMVNLINGLFSFWQEFRAEKAAQALMNMVPRLVRVLRDGHCQEIEAELLVPGDLIILSEGDRISADARLVETADLRIDQTTLTGESHPVKKTSEPFTSEGFSRIEIPNLVFTGTNVVSGTGKAVVFATGMKTEFGKVAHLTQEISGEQSPLQKEMVYVTRMVSIFAVTIGTVFFLLLLMVTSVSLSQSFIFALGMIVAFVPEGLLPTVTLALARGSQRMAKRNALVKRLSAVETLGCTSVICTDKTGTLTQNEMTVNQIWVSRSMITVTGVGYTPKGDIIPLDSSPSPDPGDVLDLLRTAGLCNNARLLPPDQSQPQWSVLGDPTEAALIVAAQKRGILLDNEVKQRPRIKEIPFSSQRKIMSTIHQEGTHRIVYLKGAPLNVLSISSAIRQNGVDEPLDDLTVQEILTINDTFAMKGLRVLAIAMRTLPDDLSIDTSENVETNMTFLGLVAMMDPPRPEVADAVHRCHQAHIRIIMITGDYGLTAKSIATRIGIVRGENPCIVSGFDLDGMTDEELSTILDGEVIFARVTPEQKLRVVSTLKKIGHIVAVTGDGVNDAPALKMADIGIAMGVSGTDVAKEAADMVLTDDNFASIVNAIEEGRAVFANIKKFTGYIFTSNTPEAIPFILFAFSKTRIPLALDVMPILAIDLGTDLLPALALGSEKPESGLMSRPPRNRNEHVISRSLLIKSYLWLGPIQSIAAMSAFYYQYWINGYYGQFLDLPASGPIYQSAVAMALAAVVTTQIGNVLAQRTERASIFEVGIFSNHLVWAGIMSELVIIMIIVYVPFFQNIFGTASFPIENWIFLFAWAPVLLIAEEIRKAVGRILDKRGIKFAASGSQE